MHCSLLLLPAILLRHGLTQTFEPPEFDIHHALAQQGVQLDRLPQAPLAVGAENSACKVACSTLAFLYEDAVVQRNTSSYTQWQQGYWSLQQATVEPSCVFQPKDAVQVSVAVLVFRLTQCPFAVKSGGHAAFAGASNIENGITVDLKKLNQVTLLENKTIASLGPGNTWYDVYAALEPERLAVVGGRVASIGVGGLILGGGISFFSGLYGLACDNVVNYEMVTASGLIINVNLQSYPDLYWALRGGGNNFGIITRFDTTTFPQGRMWGGGRLHYRDQNDAIISAFIQYGANAPSDPNAALILSFAYAEGSYFAEIDMQYAKPVKDPPIFKNFISIPNAISDTTSIRSLTNLTLQFNNSNPSGLRETYWASAYKLDEELANSIVDAYTSEIDRIRNVEGLVPACTLQIITTPVLSHMTKNGGNPLGLSTTDGPLLLMNLNTMWTHAADDSAVLRAEANIMMKVDEKAKELGMWHRYVYMNYASQFQSVISSYGRENAERLRKVATRYDPDAVFQKLQPGYFKLDETVTDNSY